MNSILLLLQCFILFTYFGWAQSFLPNAVFPSDTSTKYDIVFKENSDLDPKKSTESIQKQQSVVIVDAKSGIKYSCILPELLSLEEKPNTLEEKSIENEPLKKAHNVY